MQVDFNNLRRQLIEAYNLLVEKLEDLERHDQREIEVEVAALRGRLCILACIYDDDAGIVSLADQHIMVFQP